MLVLRLQLAKIRVPTKGANQIGNSLALAESGDGQLALSVAEFMCSILFCSRALLAHARLHAFCSPVLRVQTMMRPRAAAQRRPSNLPSCARSFRCIQTLARVGSLARGSGAPFALANWKNLGARQLNVDGAAFWLVVVVSRLVF